MLVMKVGELMGVEIKDDNISVSHRLPTSSKYKGKTTDPAIVVKFVRRDVKERYYKLTRLTRMKLPDAIK